MKLLFVSFPAAYVAICINLFSDFLWKKSENLMVSAFAGGFGCGSCWKLRFGLKSIIELGLLSFEIQVLPMVINMYIIMILFLFKEFPV